ncbi:probable F420-dependent oxidoreductase, MSMEG_2516 family [Thermomonospora echinospora]|uniref:Probable F420-dependent oxidoreductase, MSMEG_2516 family n=1 Tax=Thermomonospora echinospora TaxID=1992 RepID=A0A1H5SJP6_9ACTN|nr:TIGR03621 family F420-dependent LLM class oxidoreductase [Thermomonospora echinospora]SEF50843.1 probable F420-dependent oxidoreductase, MSMEG_2516 family [Thermomonospora echinospora]
MGVRPFRFGVVVESARTAEDLVRTARRAEELGYATLNVRDHFVREPFGDQLAPMVALTAAACATRALRVGTLVLANDYRHPVMLAKEAATLDRLSGGRLELGLGAGWLREEYERAGLPFDPPGTRVDRLAEALHVIKGLLAGEEVTFTGDHYRVHGLSTFPRPARRPPILVGAGSPRMLRLAGREADIVGVLPPARPGGTIAGGFAERLPEAVDAQLVQVRRGAGKRWPSVELSMLVSPTFAGHPRRGAEAAAARRGWPPEAVDLIPRMPSQFVGPPEHMAEQMAGRRERYGFSYYVVADSAMEDFAPVVGLLTGR